MRMLIKTMTSIVAIDTMYPSSLDGSLFGEGLPPSDVKVHPLVSVAGGLDRLSMSLVGRISLTLTEGDSTVSIEQPSGMLF